MLFAQNSSMKIYKNMEQKPSRAFQNRRLKISELRLEQFEKGNCEGVGRNFDHFSQLTIFRAKTILPSVKADAPFPAFKLFPSRSRFLSTRSDSILFQNIAYDLGFRQ